MSRQDQYAVMVSVDGTDLGTWDKLTGGEIDSEELKYKPGGMAAMVSLGGSVEIANLKVSRLCELARDHSRIHWLQSRVGKGDVIISRQPLDADANVYGSPLTYRGKLKTVTPPEIDSTSSDAGLIELEITPAGTVA